MPTGQLTRCMVGFCACAANGGTESGDALPAPPFPDRKKEECSRIYDAWVIYETS